MSYKFQSGTTDQIQVATAPIPTTGSLALWSKMAAYSTHNLPLFMVSGAGGKSFGLQIYGGQVGYSGWYDAVDDERVSPAGALNDGAWNHVFMRWTPSLLKVWLNDALLGTVSSVDGTWDTTGSTPILFYQNSVAANHFGAEVALWDAVLDDATKTALAGGAAASDYPTNLLHYWPLLSDALDAVGSDDGTVTGAVTDADHPTIGGGGGGSSLPLGSVAYLIGSISNV